MTTLIDDGLVESCLDDPGPVLDLDQVNVIDVDNIDAIIEDPGYVLEEPPNEFDQDEEYTSSYKKRSFALPVTFFDISRNIRLLKKCRPISIKIVDCDIYPWYYKRYYYRNRDKCDISIKDEDSNALDHSFDITNIKTEVKDENMNDMNTEVKAANMKDINTEIKVCATPVVPSHENQLSEEQRSVILKLKEEIDRQFCVNKENEHFVEEIDKKNEVIGNQEDLSLSNKNTGENGFDIKNELHDLLTYKEIAQVIVRNIDSSELKNKTVNSNVINNTSANDNRQNFENFDKNKTNMTKEQTVNVLISPKLHSDVRRQKKKNPQDKTLEENAEVNILKSCKNTHKKSDKLKSSTNHVIPHYHFELPSAANNYNYYCTSIVAKQMQSQTQITNDSPLHWPQINNKKGVYATSRANSIPVHYSQGRLVTSTSSVGELSYVGCNKEFRNNALVNSSLRTNYYQYTENVNTYHHTMLPNQQFNYPSSLYYQNGLNATSKYPDQTKTQNISNLRDVGRTNANQVRNEGFCVNSQASTISKDLYDNSVSNSMCSLNNYVNYSTAQVPLQKPVGNTTNIYQRNPMLSQLLNNTNKGVYYQSVLNQRRIDQRQVMGQATYSSMGESSLLSRPHYENHLRPSQFAQDKYFLFPNTKINVKPILNTEGTILCQPKESLNVNRLNNNPNASTKDKDNLNNVLSTLPNVAMSMLPKIDSPKPNNRVRTEMQNLNQVTPESCGTGTLNAMINMNAKVNDLNNFQGSKINGYSPPILPIPSFKKSLDMLSKSLYSPVNLGKRNYLGVETCQSVYNTSEGIGRDQKLGNIMRKRKLNDDDKCINSKRISLEEYKLRRTDNVIRLM